VSYEGKTGVFEFDESKVKKEDLVKAIKELGYTATETGGQ
jgi:copper chaperone CopZ